MPPYPNSAQVETYCTVLIEAYSHAHKLESRTKQPFCKEPLQALNLLEALLQLQIPTPLKALET